MKATGLKGAVFGSKDLYQTKTQGRFLSLPPRSMMPTKRQKQGVTMELCPKVCATHPKHYAEYKLAVATARSRGNAQDKDMRPGCAVNQH